MVTKEQIKKLEEAGYELFSPMPPEYVIFYNDERIGEWYSTKIEAWYFCLRHYQAMITPEQIEALKAKGYGWRPTAKSNYFPTLRFAIIRHWPLPTRESVWDFNLTHQQHPQP